MPKPTKRIVKATEIRDRDYIIFDSDIPGFGLRLFHSGKRSYMVRYRFGRKFRRMILGLHGIMSSRRACARPSTLVPPSETARIPPVPVTPLVRIVESGLIPAIHDVVCRRWKGLALWLFEGFRISLEEAFPLILDLHPQDVAGRWI